MLRPIFILLFQFSIINLMLRKSRAQRRAQIQNAQKNPPSTDPKFFKGKELFENIDADRAKFFIEYRKLYFWTKRSLRFDLDFWMSSGGPETQEEITKSILYQEALEQIYLQEKEGMGIPFITDWIDSWMKKPEAKLERQLKIYEKRQWEEQEQEQQEQEQEQEQSEESLDCAKEEESPKRLKQE